MVTQTIKVDLTKDIITDHIIFKQGEIGREIEFDVYNDGVAVDLDGYDVTFSIYKPDGNFVIVSGTIDNDTVTIEETEQMTAVCGSGCFDLALTKTNEVIYTFKGFVDIATPILTRASVNSVSTVFGLVFPDDFQEKLTAGENITIVDNVISASGGGGSSYTAGDYISILNDVIDVKSSLISTINGKADTSALNGKQDKLTAGTYIDIDASNNIDVKSSLISTINGKADTSALNGKQDKLTAGTYIDIDASNNIDVKSSLISTINGKADTSALNGKQDKLTAGTGITIDSDNVISASGGGGGVSIYQWDRGFQSLNSNVFGYVPNISAGKYIVLGRAKITGSGPMDVTVTVRGTQTGIYQTRAPLRSDSYSDEQWASFCTYLDFSADTTEIAIWISKQVSKSDEVSVILIKVG